MILNLRIGYWEQGWVFFVPDPMEAEAIAGLKLDFVVDDWEMGIWIRVPQGQKMVRMCGLRCWRFASNKLVDNEVARFGLTEFEVKFAEEDLELYGVIELPSNKESRWPSPKRYSGVNADAMLSRDFRLRAQAWKLEGASAKEFMDSVPDFVRKKISAKNWITIMHEVFG